MVSMGKSVCFEEKAGCLLEKNIDEFYERANGGFHGECKACTLEKQREYHNENRDKILLRKKEYNRKNKEKIGYITCFSVFFLDICQINVIFGNLIKRKIMIFFINFTSSSLCSFIIKINIRSELL